MGPRRNGNGSAAERKLDTDVMAIIRTLLDQQEDDANPRKLPVSLVYNRIQRSNSHLARKSKSLIEPSIERCLDLLEAEAGDSSDLGTIDGEFDGMELSEPNTASNLNKQLTKAWDVEPLPKETPAQTEAKRSKQQKRSADSQPPLKRRKTTDVDRSPPTHITLNAVGGADDTIRQLADLMVLPLKYPSLYLRSKAQPPRGILLHGPPGCGKTMMANAMAAELGVPFISIAAPSIVSGMSGESEKALREHFEEARKLAPCIIFIDEIDAITPKRETSQREMEKRIVAQLLTCMDDIALQKTGGRAVMVLAATNRPDSLDPALRRGGRFDKEINMSVPGESTREQILRALTKEMIVDSNLDFKKLAKATPGFVGADLNDLVSTCVTVANRRLTEKMKRNFSQTMEEDTNSDDNATVHELRQLIKYAETMEQKGDKYDDHEAIILTNEDFMIALPQIQPSAKREGFATIPTTTWANVGALRNVRDRLMEIIVEPIRCPERYERIGLETPTGVLLWGPPGCGKTLLAKAVANEAQANFISIKGPELLNKYVGESERALRLVFTRARSSVPCVIFIDELDALVPKRDEAMSESSARVVNTLLTELDGMESRKGIYVIGATNRPDVIDPAMLRPGRLSHPVFVDLPAEEERADILRTMTKGHAICDSPELAAMARKCQGFSGADLGNLMYEAQLSAVRRDEGKSGLQLDDFQLASTKVVPSVTNRAIYDELQRKWETKSSESSKVS